MSKQHKKRCVVSFSGGETSAYMLWYLITYMQDEYEFVVVFANTGQENEETLDFVRRCEEELKIKIVWLEAVPRFKVNGQTRNVEDFIDGDKPFEDWVGGRLGTKHRIVDFHTANRDGKVYEAVIARYGLPNISSSFSTRELKLRPITSYLRSIGWKRGTYLTAIGIREDEMDRVNFEHMQEENLWYPLIKDRPMTKPKINFFWSTMPFRLQLKGYQGNCVWCYKKSDNKLYQLYKENSKVFDFISRMEDKYGYYITPDRRKTLAKKGKPLPDLPIKVFRGGRTTFDLIREAASWKGSVTDDSLLEHDDSESCDIYSNCGDL